MPFLNKIINDYRPNAYIQGNKFTGQLVFNTQAFLIPRYTKTSLSYYFEGEYSKANLTSLNNAIKSFVTDNGLSLTNINTNISAGSENGSILVRHDMDSSVDLNSIYATNVTENINEIYKHVVSGTFTISYLDKDGNTIVSTARQNLETDGFAKDVFRYNTLYQFKHDTDLFSNQTIKFENAINKTENVIKSGDKVWIKNSENKYLLAETEQDRSKYVDGTIFFKDEDNKYDRILFEIHGFYTQDMQDVNAIPQNRAIPDDYGFKIEILPPHIKNLFTGLSDFAGDDYEFTADSTWVLEDAAVVDNFNTSVYYSQALGEHINDPDIEDVTYEIDEVWLTYDGTKFSFTFDNDHSLSKNFFSGKRA
jgi:hypothetical protein